MQGMRKLILSERRNLKAESEEIMSNGSDDDIDQSTIGMPGPAWQDYAEKDYGKDKEIT